MHAKLAAAVTAQLRSTMRPPHLSRPLRCVSVLKYICRRFTASAHDPDHPKLPRSNKDIAK